MPKIPSWINKSNFDYIVKGVIGIFKDYVLYPSQSILRKIYTKSEEKPDDGQTSPKEKKSFKKRITTWLAASGGALAIVLTLGVELVGGAVNYVGSMIAEDLGHTTSDGHVIAKDPSRAIMSGRGWTNWGKAGQNLARALDQRGIAGYGYWHEGGAMKNWRALHHTPNHAQPYNAEFITFLQPDIYRDKQGDTGYKNVVFLKNIDGLHECMTMAQNGDFKNFSDFKEQLIAAATTDKPIKIGLMPYGTGSNYTAQKILNRLLGSDYERYVSVYTGSTKMMQALEDGNIALALAIDYPGTLNGENRKNSLTTRVKEGDFSALTLNEEWYKVVSHIGYDTRAINVDDLGEGRGNTAHWACTNGTLVAGFNPYARDVKGAALLPQYKIDQIAATHRQIRDMPSALFTKGLEDTSKVIWKAAILSR